MVIGSGTRVDLTYIEEVTHGVTPGTPAMKILRATGRNINLEKNALESEEVKSNREITDVRHGFNRVVGSPGFQLSLVDFDDILLYVLGDSAWDTTVSTGTTNIAADSVGNKFTRAAGSFLTDGFRPGDIVDATGFASGNNTGQHRVLTVIAGEMAVDTTLTTEAAGGDEDITLTGARAQVGTTLTTMTVERRFVDITQFQVFRGVTVDSLSLSVQPERIVGGTINLLGMSSAVMSGTSLDATPDAVSTNQPMAAFEGEVWEGGALIALMTGLDFTLNNNRSLEGVIGSKFSPDVFEGRSRTEGTATLFLEDATLYNKFFNETGTTLWTKIAAPNGTDFLNFVFNNVKYMGAPIDPPQEGPVSISMPFRALAIEGSYPSVSIQRSN